MKKRHFAIAGGLLVVGGLALKAGHKVLNVCNEKKVFESAAKYYNVPVDFLKREGFISYSFPSLYAEDSEGNPVQLFDGLHLGSGVDPKLVREFLKGEIPEWDTFMRSMRDKALMDFFMENGIKPWNTDAQFEYEGEVIEFVHEGTFVEVTVADKFILRVYINGEVDFLDGVDRDAAIEMFKHMKETE